jgi:hypothetical protein
VGLKAAFDLGNEGLGKLKVFKSLMQGFDIVLGLLLLALQALLGFEVTSLSGFGLFFGLSFGWGHGGFLRAVYLGRYGSKDTMPHPGCQWPA